MYIYMFVYIYHVYLHTICKQSHARDFASLLVTVTQNGRYPRGKQLPLADELKTQLANQYAAKAHVTLAAFGARFPATDWSTAMRSLAISRRVAEAQKKRSDFLGTDFDRILITLGRSPFLI